MGDPADGGQRWSTGEVNNQTGATSEARWSTGGISGSGTEYGERHRKTPAGGTECRERPPPLEGPDATESERHMENDHLVIRGSVENASSGYPLVFRRRLSTAHGGGPEEDKGLLDAGRSLLRRGLRRGLREGRVEPRERCPRIRWALERAVHRAAVSRDCPRDTAARLRPSAQSTTRARPPGHPAKGPCCA